MSEQVRVRSDQELAQDIAFAQTRLEAGPYQDVWVDTEAIDLAEKCAASGIDAGRRLERQLIADALNIDIEELNRLVGDVGVEGNDG